MILIFISFFTNYLSNSLPLSFITPLKAYEIDDKKND